MTMRRVIIVIAVLVAAAVAEEAAEKTRGKRSDRGYDRGHAVEEKHTYYEKKYYKPKQCYSCSYSPPKTYYDEKVYVEHGKYGKHYERESYGHPHQSYGHPHDGGYGDKKEGGYHGGYVKKSVVPVPYTVYGGWDKCIGPFTHYEAKSYGIDEWDCHSNCYTRRDRNGDVFRGCYKGEYGVNPYKLGCHKQAGSTYCFCDGDKCNNGPSPY